MLNGTQSLIVLSRPIGEQHRYDAVDRRLRLALNRGHGGELRRRRVVALHVADDLAGAAGRVGDQVWQTVGVRVAPVRVDLDGVRGERHPVDAQPVEDAGHLLRLAGLHGHAHVPAFAHRPLESGRGTSSCRIRSRDSLVV